MQRRLSWALICVILLPSTASARNWRDASGKFSVEADFVDLRGETLRLRKQDGKIVQLPLSKLCDEDRAFARSSSEGVRGTAETAGAAPPKRAAVDAAALDIFLGSQVEEELSTKTYTEIAELVRDKLGCNVLWQPQWLAMQGLAYDQSIKPQSVGSTAARQGQGMGKTWLEALNYVAQGNWRFAGGALELGSTDVEFALYRLQAADAKNMDSLRVELRKVSPPSWQDSGGRGSIDKVAGFVLIGQTSAMQHEIRRLFKDRLQATAIADPWSLPAPTAEYATIWKSLQKTVTADIERQSLEEVAKVLAKQTGLQIDFADPSARGRVGRTTVITLNCSDAPVGRLLVNINPSISMEPGRVVVDAAAPSRTEAKLLAVDFDFGFLAGNGGGKRLDDFTPAVELVTAVQPASWTDVGGPGRIDQRSNGRTLRVSNTPPVLIEVAAIVDGLRRAGTGKGPKRGKQ